MAAAESIPLSAREVARLARALGFDLSVPQAQALLDGLAEYRAWLAALDAQDWPPDLPPARLDRPAYPRPRAPRPRRLPPWQPVTRLAPPTDDLEVAFAPVTHLATWLRQGDLTPQDLAARSLARMERLDPRLHAVVTLTAERAERQARAAHAALQRGRDRGVLHGIPWGAKDLLAVPGYPTTWGTPRYRDRVLPVRAAAVERLDAAGGVLVAKLALGELAWGDRWFGGQTRTPWDLEVGASGSSAGSAAAVAAGFVPYALGSETWGSIVSPAHRNGVTGLRPTLGRVSRYGAMPLAWSQDKIGPLCRTAWDCGWVLAALHGADPRDPASVERPFAWPPRPRRDLTGVRLGYIAPEVEAAHTDSAEGPHLQAALEVFRALGARLVPLRWPDLPTEPLRFVLEAEVGAAFRLWLRQGWDATVANPDTWPPLWRRAQFLPAVAYVQAQRLRTRWLQAVDARLASVDAIFAPAVGVPTLLITNLTGHPAVAFPVGRREDGLPAGATLIGRRFDEARLLTFVDAFQAATDFHRQRPPGWA